MNQDELINQLAGELKPFKPWPHWHWSAFLCLPILVGYGVVVLWWSELRSDWQQLLSNPYGLAETLLLVLMVLLSLRGMLLIQVPDAYQQKPYLNAPRLLLAAVCLLQLVTALMNPASWALGVDNTPCLVQLFWVGFVPSLCAAILMRQQASVQRARLGELVMWFGFAVSALLLKLSCDISSVTHLILIHYLPVLCAAAIGYGLGRVWFKQFDQPMSNFSYK
jgi:hypothetical protein